MFLSNNRVGVTRARSVPRFGPAIPEDCMFRKSAAFRQFLLTKVINGENITHHTGKFKSLAMNTRQEYLKDSIRKYRTQQGLDSTDSKFGRFGFAGRRNRDRSNKQNRPQPLTTSCGALVWPVIVTDFKSVSVAFGEVASCMTVAGFEVLNGAVICSTKADRKTAKSLPSLK